MGVLRPRNNAKKRSKSASRGSIPPASKPRATLRPPHRGDHAVLEGGSDVERGRLQRFRFVAEPYGFNDVSRNSGGQPTRDGFNFRQFGHALSVYKGKHEECSESVNEEAANPSAGPPS